MNQGCQVMPKEWERSYKVVRNRGIDSYSTPYHLGSFKKKISWTSEWNTVHCVDIQKDTRASSFIDLSKRDTELLKLPFYNCHFWKIVALAIALQELPVLFIHCNNECECPFIGARWAERGTGSGGGTMRKIDGPIGKRAGNRGWGWGVRGWKKRRTKGGSFRN